MSDYTDKDKWRNQAIGWLIGATISRSRLEREAERAEQDGHAEIAAQLREWVRLTHAGASTAPCDDCGKPVPVPDDWPVDWAYCGCESPAVPRQPA